MDKWEYCRLQTTTAHEAEPHERAYGSDAGVTYYRADLPRTVLEALGDPKKKPLYSFERKMLERMKAHQQKHDLKADPLLDRLDRGPPTDKEEAAWNVDITFAFEAKISDLGLDGWEMVQVSEDGQTIWFKRRV